MNMTAQGDEASHRADAPLVLQALGSFYVGGGIVSQTAAEIGLYDGGPTIVDQMYVQYMVPQEAAKPAVVMIHGACLSGKSYETTPDGRMGWYEYFTRKGNPSYVVDQVARARSGFNQAFYNSVRSGFAAPGEQPNIRRVAMDVAWVRLRIGPTPGVAFPDTQFPVEAMGEFAKQMVPDLSDGLHPDDPNIQALCALAKQVEGTVLIGHSQAAKHIFESALLNPENILGLVAIEPPGCNSSSYSEEQIIKLSKTPILVLFGDHIDDAQSIGPDWKPLFIDAQQFVARLNAANGNATMLHTTDLGIRGNSHMLMQDTNNIQIADLVMKWIDENVRHK